MKNIYLFIAIIICKSAFSQNLNWNTSTYSTESLTHNFGVIGSPPSLVQLSITGNTNLFQNGSPYRYQGAGFANCSQICAMREVIDFTAIGQIVTHTFTFSPVVAGLSFTIYDIDYSNPGAVTYDLVKITAKDGSTLQNITINDIDGFTTITNNNTTSPSIRGIASGVDNRVNFSVSGNVSELVITFELDPASATFTDKSISIGNMNWLSVLPIKMESVFAKSLDNDTNVVSWTSTDETNLDYYFIEKSTDGIVFNKIGTQRKNNTTNDKNYQFFDLNPSGGMEYYRIGMVDLNGTTTLSKIVRTNGIKFKSESITIIPNPTKDFITIQSLSNSKITSASIYNLVGVKVYENKIFNSNYINIATLKPGLYSLKLNKADGGFITERFIKQ